VARPVPCIAVVGAGRDASARDLAAAEEAGAAIAAAGATLVCGGLGGVLEAACRGARSGGGFTLGLLPGDDREDANGWVVLALPTGLGEGRNALIVRAADAVVVVGGSWGTLSELALARRGGTPVITLGGWRILDAEGRPVPGPVAAADPAEAVRLALAAAERAHPLRP
jgi:uncharacterized protein (TIGR00725 family)